MNTKAQEINWDQAPEGATHYTKANSAASKWLKVEGIGLVYYWDYPGWMEYSCDLAAYEHLDQSIERPSDPEPAAWNGEGLPPVGTVCEALNGFKEEWRKVKILDHEGTVPTAACRDEIGRLWWSQCFRPIRTPEQIAAEERSARICEMASVIGAPLCQLTPTEIIEKLDDAGYRKTQTVDKV